MTVRKKKTKFSQFTHEVLALNEPPIRAKGTLRQMAQVLREFSQLPTIEMADDLTIPAIAAWIRAHPDRTAVRTASLLRSLSSACAYAVAAGYIPISPFSYRRVGQWVRDQPVAPDRPREPQHQSAEAVDRLLRMLDAEAAGGSWKSGRMQAFAYLLAYTGVRKGEALALKKWDIDLARQTLSIQPRLTFRPKTRKSVATIPLADPLVRVLGLWLPMCGDEWVFPGVRMRGPWLGGSPGSKPLDELKAAGRRAGIHNLTIAGFRKTIGTHAKRWGLGQLELKALLRHSNVETQRWYDEEQVESLRPAVARIHFGAASDAVAGIQPGVASEAA